MFFKGLQTGGLIQRQLNRETEKAPLTRPGAQAGYLWESRRRGSASPHFPGAPGFQAAPQGTGQARSPAAEAEQAGGALLQPKPWPVAPNSAIHLLLMAFNNDL